MGNVRIMEENVNWGVYVWQCADGELLGDEDGNLLNVASKKGDPRAMEVIAAEARNGGYGEGKPLFWAGRRPVSDEEYEYQRQREMFGLEPDPAAPGASF